MTPNGDNNSAGENKFTSFKVSNLSSFIFIYPLGPKILGSSVKSLTTPQLASGDVYIAIIPNMDLSYDLLSCV